MIDDPWYRTDPAALASAVRDALVMQPALRLHDDGARLLLRGRFDIREHDELIESFSVEIEPAPDSSRGLPKAWEVGGRIPRVSDPHHVNVHDGTLCVVLPEAFWYEHPTGSSLAEFLGGPLRRHLAGQSILLRGGSWPVGEWRHGFGGIFQFYVELFEARNEHQLHGFLQLLVRDRVKGHWTCPCESGRKLRQCHGQQVHRARANVPEHLLEPIRLYIRSFEQKSR